MAKQPWMKFYPTDWRADPALRVCSLAARGLWIEMLAIMHEAEPRGHLLVKGRLLTVEQLAALTGSNIDECSRLLEELETAGVFDRRKNGVIVSRRMERDEILSRKNRENGQKGGNPKLCNQTQNAKSFNPPNKGPDKAKKPEVRSQIKKETTSQKKETARGSRLPDNWEPNAELMAWCASELDCHLFEIETTAQAFRDYWHSESGQRASKLDWDKTFKNWCRREGKYSKAKGNGRNKGYGDILKDMIDETRNPAMGGPSVGQLALPGRRRD